MESFSSSTKSTKVVFSADARKQLYEGLRLAADAIGCTLGPRGKTVLLQSPGMAPVVTKDGVSVAKAIRLSDPVKDMGSKLVLEAAQQTNEAAGDGTTTASVLTQALVKEGLKMLDANFSARDLCRGIERAAARVDAELVLAAKKLTTPEEIAQVGTISANGDEQIGDLISRAMQKVGRDGIITVEDAKGTSTTLEVVEGMQFDRGYLSPYFVTNPERMNVAYNDALLLVTTKKLSNLRELVPILEQIVQMQRPLVIIADDVEGEALHGLVLNRVKSGLPVVAVKAPGYGQQRSEMLQDICSLTGAKLVASETGLQVDKLTVKDLGTCKRVIIDSKSSTLVGDGKTKDQVDQHVAELRAQLEDLSLSVDDKARLQTRIARLSGGVAVIRVGGATEIEMGERKFRIEDALNATKAAADEGIVPGGGMALFNAYRVLGNEQAGTVPKDEQVGAAIVMGACLAPLRKIAENAGVSPDVVIAELQRLQPGTGYNAATGEYQDLAASGVIDPVKVTRTALKNAVSVAVTFLNLDAVIVEEENEATRERR